MVQLLQGQLESIAHYFQHNLGSGPCRPRHIVSNEFNLQLKFIRYEIYLSAVVTKVVKKTLEPVSLRSAYGTNGERLRCPAMLLVNLLLFVQ